MRQPATQPRAILTFFFFFQEIAEKSGKIYTLSPFSRAIQKINDQVSCE